LADLVERCFYGVNLGRCLSAYPVVLSGRCSGFTDRWFNNWRFLINNDNFRDNMIHHLGFGYFLQYGAQAALPIFALVAYSVYDLKVRRKREGRFFSPEPHIPTNTDSMN
jgi:hypothetical protein